MIGQGPAILNAYTQEAHPTEPVPLQAEPLDSFIEACKKDEQKARGLFAREELVHRLSSTGLIEIAAWHEPLSRELLANEEIKRVLDTYLLIHLCRHLAIAEMILKDPFFRGMLRGRAALYDIASKSVDHARLITQDSELNNSIIGQFFYTHIILKDKKLAENISALLGKLPPIQMEESQTQVENTRLKM